jgi:hypothetical protein
MRMGNTYCSPVKVVLRTQNDGLVLRNPFDLVTPLSGDLDSSLDRLRTSVHGEDHVETKELGDDLGELGKDIVIESPRAKGQTRGLLDERSDKFGVAVALVHR